jgi:hypothetical protein
MTASFAIRNSVSQISPLIASEQKLLMMRPVQVYQAKAIVQCTDDNCGSGARISVLGNESPSSWCRIKSQRTNYGGRLP